MLAHEHNDDWINKVGSIHDGILSYKKEYSMATCYNMDEPENGLRSQAQNAT